MCYKQDSNDTKKGWTGKVAISILSKFKNPTFYRVGEVEIHPDHGRNPSEKEMREVVSKWLLRILCPFTEDTHLHIKVWGWNWYVRKRVGVRVFGVHRPPLSNVVEIRVTLPEDIGITWRCQLICPSDEVACDIVATARPTSVVMAERIGETTEERKEPVAVSRKHKRAMARAGIHRPDRATDIMMKAQVLNRVCHIIWQRYKHDPFPISEMVLEAARLSEVALNQDTETEFAQAIFMAGLVQPHVDWRKISRCRATEVLEERAHDYEDVLRHSEIEILERRIDSSSRDKVAAEKELARLLERAASQRETISRLDGTVSDATKQLAKLRGQVSGEIFEE